MCGGDSGKVPNSALWMYNKLMKCKNVEQLQYNKDKHFVNMSKKDINYLNSIDDESQYPAARCAMDLSVFMYSRSSSGTAESMNKANKEMRARTAVDLLNACIMLLIKSFNHCVRSSRASYKNLINRFHFQSLTFQVLQQSQPNRWYSQKTIYRFLLH